MLKGFWKLSWVEIKIFLREPMGVVGTLGLPVLLFVVLGRSLRTVRPGADTIAQAPFNVAILAALMIAVNAVLSLVAVISIYREGGILKRLRAPMASFTAALLLSSLSIMSLGFVIASIIPTARFAQPIGAAILYPMIALSGLFVPIERLPSALRIVAYALPTTHAVSLMQGVWDGSGWTAHWGNAVALLVVFAVCSALASKVFRWE